MGGSRAWLGIGLVAALAGCGPAAAPALGAYAGVEIASVALFHRGLGDIVVSAISGRDCSIVRLDRGLSYCVPAERPPPPAFCTRTLGRVMCWADPANVPAGAEGVADPPPSPTPVTVAQP